jgi:two-component system OmpR family sensor kinase
MQLAKAEGGGLIAATARPLAPVLRLVVEDVDRNLDLDGRLELALPDGDAPLSDLDPDAFAILARNLIENAVKHGDPDEPIKARLALDGFSVANRGPVVPPERLRQLTRPFQRGPTQADGSGLGLAIVSAICRGAGLSLELASPRRDTKDGFVATVRFSPPGQAKLTAS